ncbi:MAG: hypothetical protein RLZZ467_1287, partial [Gemmatimonadota bacterium]
MATLELPVLPTRADGDGSVQVHLDPNEKITVGTIRLVSVKVESCFGSHPICSTRFPSFEKAALRFEEVVDFPIPP